MNDAHLPYVRFYMSDWLAATRGMKASEIGIYFTLLALMYERGEPVPEHSQRLARQCGCTPKTFEDALEMLVDEGKIVRKGGGLWNNRVEKEFAFRAANSNSQSANAKKRWEKTNKNNDPVMPSHNDGNTAAMPKPECRSQIIDIQTPNGVFIAPAGAHETPEVSQLPEPKPEKAKRVTRAALLAELSVILDDKHANAVIDHRETIRKKLSVRAAELLAGKFRACAERGIDPNDAADLMISNGWQGFEVDWVENAMRRTAPGGGRRQQEMTPLERMSQYLKTLPQRDENHAEQPATDHEFDRPALQRLPR